jgi:superfamily I DNA/RNA helicase
VRLDTYDHVLIDEAQFFAPIWFELVKMAIAPRGGQLFMAADPNQGFLQRKLSWLKAGLEVRGRTLRLHRSYRTTREILQAATQFLRAVTGFDQEAVAPDYRAMPRGEKPVLMEADTPQDEVTRVANEIAELAKQGVALHHILVIHAWPIIKDQLANELERMLGQGKVRDLNDRADHGLSCDDAVRLVSLNSATGLEAPVVFLTGVGQVFEAERSLRKTEAEHQEARETNARRLHMAMTRAGQLMVLSTSGPIPPELTVAGVRQDHSG